MLTSLLVMAVVAATDPAPATQYSFTIWDWSAAGRDADPFQGLVNQLDGYGFTCIELGVSWAECEPVRARYDFTALDHRLAYIKARGMSVRLRVNVTDWPAWFDPERCETPEGKPFDHSGGLPSLFSIRNRERQLAFVSALAEHTRGNGYTYTPGFSVHMEVKFGAWAGYEPSARNGFRTWLAGRYGSVAALNEAWRSDFRSFDDIAPPIPEPTDGVPSLDPRINDWIRFREAVLTAWVEAFASAVRRADPTARVSVPLGESFRRESAAFANLAYWAYSRTADEVVHSYDFFLHGPERIGDVTLATAIMSGITRRPVVFEIDGPTLVNDHGYSPELLVEAGKLALNAGASGVQVTNRADADLSGQHWMKDLGALLKAHRPTKPEPAERLYYVSKWQNYVFRESDESFSERQWALWRKLRAANVPVRVVTDENLLYEDLNPEIIFIPHAAVIDEPVRDRLRALSYGARLIADDRPGVFSADAKTTGAFGAHIEIADKPFADASLRIEALLSGPSKKTLRVAAVQFPTTFDVRANAQRIVDLIGQAAEAGARVAVFSEMALTGYTKDAAFGAALAWNTVDNALLEIKRACKDHRIYAVVGAPKFEGESIYCAAFAIDPDGKIIDSYEKIYPAGEAWATPGRAMSTFDIDGIRCATIICHDERYPHLVQLRALAGAQVFFYISCESGLAEEHKIGPYRAQLQARAVENEVYVVHANAPASRDDPTADGTSNGHSRIIAPDGNILAEAGPYDDTMVIATITADYASRAGRDAAVKSGPAAEWLQKGLGLVTGK